MRCFASRRFAPCSSILGSHGLNRSDALAVRASSIARVARTTRLASPCFGLDRRRGAAHIKGSADRGPFAASPRTPRPPPEGVVVDGRSADGPTSAGELRGFGGAAASVPQLMWSLRRSRSVKAQRQAAAALEQARPAGHRKLAQRIDEWSRLFCKARHELAAFNRIVPTPTRSIAIARGSAVGRPPRCRAVPSRRRPRCRARSPAGIRGR